MSADASTVTAFATQEGLGRRHAGLHESRADARSVSGQAHGHLGVRLRALRADHRPRRVCAPDDLRHHRSHPRSRAGLGVCARDRTCTGVEPGQAVSRQRFQAASSRHRRCAYSDRRDPVQRGGDYRFRELLDIRGADGQALLGVAGGRAHRHRLRWCRTGPPPQAEHDPCGDSCTVHAVLRRADA